MSILMVELRKAMLNRWFVVAAVVGCALAICSAIGNIELYMTTAFEDDELGISNKTDLVFGASTLYRFLMVNDYIQWSVGLFFALLPVLACLPYAWSLAHECRIGYVQNVYVRTERKKYAHCKTVAAFLSAACAVGLPIVLNYVICACFIPAYPTDVGAVIYTGIYDSVLFSSVYYTNPLLYCLLYLILNMVFSGLLAATVMLLGQFVVSSTRLIAGSAVFLYMLGALESKLALACGITDNDYISVLPQNFLRGTTMGPITSEVPVIIWFIALVLISVFSIFLSSRRDVL